MKKLNDGQFEECDITLAELKAVEKSICWIVQSMFHQRIEYPKPFDPKTKQPEPAAPMRREGS
jgi:membrane-associated HD superfamily phosphohydrolase